MFLQIKSLNISFHQLKLVEQELRQIFILPCIYKSKHTLRLQIDGHFVKHPNCHICATCISIVATTEFLNGAKFVKINSPAGLENLIK
jgi:hypothetical protein